MIYISRQDGLPILECETEKDTLLINEIKECFYNFASEIIYCECNGKLFGIVTGGDIYRSFLLSEGNLETFKINKTFTVLNNKDSSYARQIFWDKSAIHQIPVVNEQGALQGAFQRYDEILWVEQALRYAKEWSCDGKLDQKTLLLPKRANIYKKNLAEKMRQFLLRKEIKVRFLEYDKMHLLDNAEEVLICDEEEKKIIFNMQHSELLKDCVQKVQTYKDFLMDSQKGGRYLFQLKEQGCTILSYSMCSCLESEKFWLSYRKAIEQKFIENNEPIGARLPKGSIRDFYCELYTDEYVKQNYAYPFKQSIKGGISILQDCFETYHKILNGVRQTVAQPSNYTRTVWFFGPCYILGRHVEDQYTIESYLQKMINDKNYPVRVVNCGVIGDENVMLSKVYDTEIYPGDIIVLSDFGLFLNETEIIDVLLELKQSEALAEWLIDTPYHCNHKVNEIYANAVMRRIEPLLEKRRKKTELFKKKSPIKELFLDKYFGTFKKEQYSNIGAIVMNCNPFTKGHRYLIEEAKRVVDYLIIFVVEEDLSYFSFHERYAMVAAGVEDIEDIAVVPSGPYILSKTTFPEYFEKQSDEELIRKTEEDIMMFADYIAPRLGITHRFVGEEKEDVVTWQYNQAMKKILPSKGIKLIEISRKEFEKESVISASKVRKILKGEIKDTSLECLVPTSTLKFL